MFSGRGGQKFIERCVPKVAELRARFPDKDIEVDGGVSPKTVDVCAQAGMSYLCLGANYVSLIGKPLFRKQCHSSWHCYLRCGQA
jgi:pentose-5-phosphate-3-epimerase